MANEIYHFGVIGMRWGVRRYQNPDGSLTAAGRKKYNKGQLYKKNGELNNAGKAAFYKPGTNELSELGKKELRKYSKDAGLDFYKKDLDESPVYKMGNGDYKIPKGSQLYRLTTFDEPIDEKRKYVTVTNRDRETYTSRAEHFIKDYSDRIATHYYESTKDLKVASGESVAKYVLSKYGNEKSKAFNDEFVGKYENIYWNTDSTEYYQDHNKRMTKDAIQKKWIHDRAYDGKAYLTGQLNKSMFRDAKESDEIFNHFRKKGYDAIVDAEDYHKITGYESTFPLILLSPYNSIKGIKKEDYLTFETYNYDGTKKK